MTRPNVSLKCRSGGDYLHFIVTVLCYRLAVGPCRKLRNSQAALDALIQVQTDLGSGSCRPRTIELRVPGR